MKLQGLIAAPLVAVLATALSATSSQELPQGWMRTGDASVNDCRVAAEAAKDAPTPKVFVIDCVKGTKGFATFMQTISALEYAGKRVRLSAQVQGDGLTNWAGAWLRGDAGSERGIAFENMYGRPLQGSFGWREVQVVLDIPAQVDQLAFGVLLNGSGRLQATKIQLDVVPTTVAITGPAKQVLPTRPLNTSPQ